VAPNFNELASPTWSVGDLVTGEFKQSDDGKVILPFTLMRRPDCVLEADKAVVQTEVDARKGQGIELRQRVLPAKLTHYKLSGTGTQAIKPGQDVEEYKLKPLTDIGSGKSHEPEVAMLSAKIATMNDRFEGDPTVNGLLALANHVRELLVNGQILAEQAGANTKVQFGASPGCKNVMLDSVAEGLDKHQEMVKQVLTSPRAQDGLSKILLDLVFFGFASRRA
jgi:hypothetical protein